MNPNIRRARYATLLLCAGLAAAVSLPAFAQVMPALDVSDTVDLAENDGATTTITWTLSAPATTEVRFTLMDANIFPGHPLTQATPGDDYVPVVPTLVVVPPGTTTGTFAVEALGDQHAEGDEGFVVRVIEIVGANLESWEDGQALVVVRDNDPKSPADWVVRDDRFTMTAGNVARGRFDLTENDLWDRAWFTGVTTTIIEPATHGVVTVASSAGIGWIDYEPENGFYGTDTFRYRLCVADGTCREARAEIKVVPLDFLDLAAEGHSGYRFASYNGIGVHAYRPTPAVAPVLTTPLGFGIGVDRTHRDPWDGGGTQVFRHTLPALPAGETREYRVHFAGGTGRGNLFVGTDTAGGVPAEDSVLCHDMYYCEITLVQGPQPVTWWAMVHNLDPVPGNGGATMTVYEMPVEDDPRGPSFTAPGRQPEPQYEHVRIAWNDPTLINEEPPRRGMVRVYSPDGAFEVDMPLTLSRYSDTQTALPLVAGAPTTLRLRGGSAHDRMFIDVPAGATRLDVEIGSDTPVEYYLARQTAAVDPTDVTIPAAPDASTAATTGNTAGGTTVATVSGGTLAAGRWYVVPRNPGADPVAVTLTATIAAVAPAVRPGSYFNAARSGSGVFLYPAGSEWTGLWYTYFDESRPTWYYLQAAAPAVDGLWTSRIYRATWSGTSRTLTAVGHVTVTPTGDDQFTMTYLLDGIAGSQPMAALGRGCPLHEGTALDVSNQWFDPAKVGTGYSVQMWAGYEYFAAFVYDAQGVPVFLAAENGSFGGAEATLDLQRLKGACPTCAWQAPPARENVGTFVRRVTAGSLSTIEVDAIWDEGAPFAFGPTTWTAVDDVTMLGGDGTAQGCDP